MWIVRIKGDISLAEVYLISGLDDLQNESEQFHSI
jgi:hypothetical protein